MLAVFRNLKYAALGQKVNRKFIVFESDDWGSIRMSSERAKKQLLKNGENVKNNPFNQYDILEQADDFTALFEVLQKYNDKNNRPPIITANTIMANPNFDRIEMDHFQSYHYELFTETYKTYWSRNDTFNYFSDGIKNRFIMPQFHGREHVNVAQWLKGLQSGDQKIHEAFNEKVFGIDFKSKYSPRTNFMATYDFDTKEELNQINKGIEEGLDLFEKVFGFSSLSSIAPAAVWHPEMERTMALKKVKYLQGFIVQNIPVEGEPQFEKKFHYHGDENTNGQKYLVRNCYFEPSTNANIDWVDKCLSQIKRAFLFKKPAVISTHRINFVGGIEEKNRSKNLKLLDQLLYSILSKWPDVTFLSSDELGDLMTS